MDDATALQGTEVFNTWDEPCRLDIILGEELQKSRYANFSSKQALRAGESIHMERKARILVRYQGVSPLLRMSLA